MTDRLLTVDQLIDELKRYNHRELHVHHTWRPSHADFNRRNYQAIQDGMRRNHIYERGFSDIAQHVTLFPDGMFLTGRDFGKNPASILGHNHGLPFCVEMLGDFDKGRDKFEGAQKAAMLKLAKWFADRGKYIRFHRENAPWKTCPGTSIDKDEFMREVKAFGAQAQAVPAPKTEVKSEVVRATNSILERGDRGEAVAELQRKLTALGFDCGAADGVFGEKTEAALIAFQKAAKIGVDGIYGPQTAKALANYKPAKRETYTLPNGTFKRGDRGEAVKQIQRALKAAKFDPGAIDGIYGVKTENAVRSFQKKYGVKPYDGIFGAKTKAKLAEVLR
jgi:peptidoglycan hydrolase-like protein with peptidoglycan-binding domain